MSHSFDFEQPYPRDAVPGEKWGKYAGRDILPLWVADMDFAAPQVIIDAIAQRLQHPIFGYTDPWPSLVEAVIEGIARDHDWRIDPSWLVWLPGMVCGFNVACRAVGSDDDEVFTATPVYPPFLVAPANNRRRLVSTTLRLQDKRWEWDRAATEAAISLRTKLWMLCNPHNPVGRVFDREELCWIADLAERHDLVICSDEIHCGLVLDETRPHIPIAALDESVARRTITLMAPSKTWNIPALYCAFAIIPDPALRRSYQRAMRGLVSHPNVLGLVATEAAYRDADPWRLALLEYLRGNRARVLEAVADMPGLTTTSPEATYLAWIDCRDAGLANPVEHFEQHGVGLSDGAAFGMPGFVRLNFGCTRTTLNEALSRMQNGLANR